MVRYTPLIAALLLALPGSSGYADSSAKGSLAQCQRVKERIDHYTDLRRHGGSRKQMQRWQRQRNDSRQRYSELDCKRHRQALK